MAEATQTRTQPKYWRSIEDNRNKEDNLETFVEKEFPSGAHEMSNPVTRRNFMHIMGASAALAGLTACRMPKEKIVPFVTSPENLTPGTPKYYATSMNIGSHVQGLLVKSTEGRPTYIQGNDKHPSSLGAPGLFAQASILSLYDPDRIKVPSQNEVPKTWAEFETFWRQLAQQDQGNTLILSQVSPSPTLERLKKSFLQKYPKATWLDYESIHHRNMDEAMSELGVPGLEPYYQLEKADVILSIGHDFLETDPDAARYQHDFAHKRRVHQPGKDLKEASMNRLYVVESGYSLTGSNADHRLRLNPSETSSMVAQLYQALSKHISLPNIQMTPPHAAAHQEWIDAAALDLIQHPGTSVVSAGPSQSKDIHMMVQLINQALSNIGRTVVFVKPFSHSTPLDQIKATVESSSIQTIITLGCNPVYDLNLDGKALSQGKTWIAASLEPSETTLNAQWVLPLSHYLESWSDAVSVEGLSTINQPLIRPLFDSKSIIEITKLMTDMAPAGGHELVKKTWKDQNWDQVLHDGAMGQPRFESPSLQTPLNINIQKASQDIEIEFVPSPCVYDGRFANNGWLQEMPHPITKIAWDNPALISPAMAKEYKLKNGQLIELSKGDQSIQIPAWIVPGQAARTITLELGYGRGACGRIGKGIGTNVLPLRGATFNNTDTGFSLKALSGMTSLANTQDHGRMEGRPLVREASLSEFKERPQFAKEAVHHPPLKSLWKEHDYSQGYQWGMSIDLNTCTGCNACMIACQSENNIPIVGKKQVELGREMSWIRMDRYFTGSEDDPMVVFQPVACVQCENAPCEQVCPVNATVHDDEGLNTMVYNRCIGTRYCSNNCPYKVRRFNFFNYVKESPLPTATSPLVQMANNPEVTVRFRGVMEKCTYCTQRIEGARSKAKLEDRSIKDGDIKTACQVACPSDAIVFGNINDPESRVSKLKALDQDYAMLSEINIKPRTTYLAKLRNPNPKLVKKDTHAKGEHHGGHA